MNESSQSGKPAAQNTEAEWAQDFATIRPRLLVLMCVSRIPPEDCEDLVQDVLTAAQIARVRRRGPVSAGFAAWVHGIAHNQIREYWRRKGRIDRRLVLPTSAGAESGLNPLLDNRAEPEHLNIDIALTVREIMSGLPPRERTILYLSAVRDLSTEQIAERLGIPKTTVWRTLRSAGQHFSKRFLDQASSLKRLK